MKNEESFQSYFLASRSLGIWSLTLTLLATQIGGGAMIATANLSYEKGVWGVLYNLSIILGFLVLGTGLGSKLRSFNVLTIGQLMEKAYGGAASMRKLSGLVFAIAMFGLFVGQIVASKAVLKSMGIEHPIWLMIFWGTIFAYASMGGFKAVVATDIMQVLMIIFGFSFMSIFALKDTGGLINLFSATAQSSSLSEISFTDALTMLVMPFGFCLIEPDMTQRVLAAKDGRVVSWSCLLSAAGLFLFALLPIVWGFAVRNLGMSMSEGDSALILLANSTMGQFGVILLGVVLLLAIASTADSLLCAISSSIVGDLIPEAPPKTLTIIISLIGITLAMAWDSVFGVLIKSYSFAACTFMVPVLAAYFIKKPNYPAAIGSMIVGTIGFILCQTEYTPPCGEVSILIAGFVFYSLYSSVEKIVQRKELHAA